MKGKEAYSECRVKGFQFYYQVKRIRLEKVIKQAQSVKKEKSIGFSGKKANN